MALRDAAQATVDVYPYTLPVVRALTRPLALDECVTLLVGDNGSGKSTLVEALAVAAGFNAEGGSPNFAFSTRDSTSPLHRHLQLVRSPVRPRTSFFLRAESFYNVATEVDDLGPDILEAYGSTSLHEQSHGESFLSLVMHRFGPDGLYLMDEPEAALSPYGCLALLRRMHDLAAAGGQFVVATHSPLLMAYPGATIYELTDAGIATVDYDDVDTVQLYRSFLSAPEQLLRHLLAGD